MIFKHQAILSLMDLKSGIFVEIETANHFSLWRSREHKGACDYLPNTSHLLIVKQSVCSDTNCCDFRGDAPTIRLTGAVQRIGTTGSTKTT